MTFGDTIKKQGLLLAVWVMMCSGANAAVLTVEDFASGAADWSDRDGVMSFSAPGGALVGSFGASDFPLTDAFTVSSGDFIGDYLDAAATAWIFSFSAATVAPSDISIWFGGNSELFYLPLSPSFGTTQYSVSLTYSGLWFGTGGSGEFNSALSNVEFIEIQFTSSGTGAQTYTLNSFELSGQDIGGGGGGGLGAIPEPGSSLFVMGAIWLFVLRRLKVA